MSRHFAYRAAVQLQNASNLYLNILEEGSKSYVEKLSYSFVHLGLFFWLLYLEKSLTHSFIFWLIYPEKSITSLINHKAAAAEMPLKLKRV